MISEQELEAKLKGKVEKLGGLCLKFYSSISGVPDRIVLIPGGKVYFVEMKCHKGKLSALQTYSHKILRKLDFLVFVIDSEEKINIFIDDIQGI